MSRRNGKRLVALYGYPGSGKDTVAGMMKGWTRVAFADPVREMVLALNPIIAPPDIRVADAVHHLGWDGAKRDSLELRYLLQRMGTEAGRRVLGDNVWIRKSLDRICSVIKCDGRVVLTDTRFSNEYDLVRDMGGVVVKVERNGCCGMNHESEKHYDEFTPDYVIENNGSIDLLRESVETLLTCLSVY